MKDLRLWIASVQDREDRIFAHLNTYLLRGEIPTDVYVMVGDYMDQLQAIFSLAKLAVDWDKYEGICEHGHVGPVDCGKCKLLSRLEQIQRFVQNMDD